MSQHLATVVPQLEIMRLPANALERMQLAEKLATARLVPPAFQKSPADIFLAMNTCERMGLDFFLTIGECYVVQGKVGFSGKLASAILNSSGVLSERLSYDYEGEGDDRTVTVRGRIQGEADAREVKLRLGDVRTRNEQWSKQPDQMLGYAGSRTWGRRHLSEVLLGMRFEDEVQDMVDVTPPPPEATNAQTMSRKMQKPPKDNTYTEVPLNRAAAPPKADPATYNEQMRKDLDRDPIEKPKPVEATEPYSLEYPGTDTPDRTEAWRAWCALFIGYVRAAKTLEDVQAWCGANTDAFDWLQAAEPRMHKQLENALDLDMMRRRDRRDP